MNNAFDERITPVEPLSNRTSPELALPSQAEAAVNMSTESSASSKQQIAYEYIKSGIARGAFAPRQRLVIDSLARDLEISKVPVREAIRRLEAEGLVEFNANSGAVVAAADIDVWYHLIELLAVLEGYATAAAAPNMTRARCKRLREINEGMRDALERYDLKGWTEGNQAFHRTINACSHNPALIEQMAKLQMRTAAINRFIFPQTDAAILHTLGPDGGKSALDAHEWLIQAFERHEGADAIERHAREHILRVAARTRELVRSSGDALAPRKKAA